MGSHQRLKPAHTGFRHVWYATVYSLRGLRAAWTWESAFRQEFALAVLALPLGFWLGQTPAERAVLVGCMLLVLVVELLNSAIEATIDRIGHDYDPDAGRAKDLGSAAVMTSLMIAGLVWLIVLWDRLFAVDGWFA